MSLLDKASLIVTPNSFKASKLYSVVPSSGAGDMTVVRATTATRVNSDGLIESVANNVPRIDYTNGSCPSLLVEPQRTNLLLYSNGFNNLPWVKNNSTIDVNSIISPDGTQNAAKLNVNTTPYSGVYNVFSGSPNIYTMSIFVKKGNKNWLGIVDVAGNDINAWFNISNGTLGTVNLGTATIVDFGNGWYRCTYTNTSIAVGNVLQISFVDSNNSNTPTSNGFGYIYGSQVEIGSYATSYIPTVASTVTRNADVISKTGISSLIGQTEGTIYSEIKVNKLIGTASRYIFHISDETVNNRIYMAFSGSSSNVLRARIFNGGTLQCSIDSSTITNTGTYKLALAYKNNDIVFYINGVEIGVDTIATIPTCSKVDIGHNYAGASQLGDGISNSIIFKTRLSNTELTQLTIL